MKMDSEEIDILVILLTKNSACSFGKHQAMGKIRITNELKFRK
jgi:hypothetical protein